MKLAKEERNIRVETERKRKMPKRERKYENVK